MRLEKCIFFLSLFAFSIPVFARRQHTHIEVKGDHAVHKHVSSGKGSNIFLFPDFYHYQPKKKGDTTWSYECSDVDLHVITPYDLKDVEEIDQVKYYVSYYAYPVKPGSIVSPPYLNNLIYKYAHPGADKWIGIDPLTGRMSSFMLHKNEIVRTESLTLSDPATGKKRKVIYKYFKTEQHVMEPGQTP